MELSTKMVDRKTAAALYSTTYGTLANLACRGLGPKFYRRGTKCLYKVEDLEKYFAAVPVETSDSAEARSSIEGGK
ncbi:MAG: helix-turn-helix domain-containing protein [Pseudomonadota bacterium]